MKKVVILLAAVFMLFPCFGEPISEVESPAWDIEKNYIVSMGLFGDLLESYRSIAESDDFKAAFPNVTIEFVDTDWDGHHYRLINNIYAGERAHDIEIIDEAYLPEFLQSGGFSNLLPMGAEAGTADLLPFALERAVTAEGKLIALPVSISPVVMYYRSDLADAAGADFDTISSWDEWLDEARKVSVDTDGDGSIDQFAVANARELALVALNSGIAVWLDENGNILEPKKNFIDVLEVIKTVSDEGLHANYMEWSDPWIASYSQESKGAAVCTFKPAWFESAFQNWLAPDLEGKYRAARIPGGASASIDGVFMAIPETTIGSEKRALCYDIVKFFATNKSAQLITLDEYSFSAQTLVYDSAAIEKEIEYFGGQKVREIYLDSAMDVPSSRLTEYDKMARDAWMAAVDQIVEGDYSAEEAYQLAYDRIDEIVVEETSAYKENRDLDDPEVESPANDSAIISDMDVTLSFGLFGDLMPSYEAIINSDEFRAAFPNVRISFEESDWDGHHRRLLAVISAGERANDIEVIEESYIDDVVSSGGFTDLYSFGAAQITDRLIPFAVNRVVAEDGQLVALPVDIAPVVMYYRADLADAAGADFDNLSSWAEWIEQARKVSADTDGDGMNDQFAIAYALEMAVVSLNNGIGDWHDENGNLLEPKEKYIDILQAVDVISREKLHGRFAEWSDPWIASYSKESRGASVCAFNGSWFEGSLKGWMAPDMAGKYRVAKLPGGAAANLGSTYLGIPESTPPEYRQLAYKVVEFFSTNVSAQTINLEEIGAFPALVDAFYTDATHKGVEYFGGQQACEIYAEVAENISPAVSTVYDEMAREIWISAATRIIEEGVSPEEAYEQALDQMSILWR